MMLTTSLIMLWPLVRERALALRALLVAGAAVIAVLTALDRVFLGVHYPSDVTAGVLLGCGLSVASFLGFSHRPRATKEPV